MSTAWFKSTFSGSETSCVEVAHRTDTVLIRDSKYTGPAAEQPVVSVSPAMWPAFLDLALSANSGTLDEGVTVSLHQDGGATISAQGVALLYNADEWDAFTKGVADGQFDRR
ncbi:DUF397 domain-containing protein [Nocardia sp. NBC_00508]|uniref:DUF397 domain-containing protein n=1 Tax=Nocardia sp. NBC_00508 TaxID=2975992 RepID=UPI002E8130D8|nr:DUF397 domain-containing protein [Nocardia sp. NBC_00508]WUD69346.1 DUF397 domain-containing protein [Nocardia sp. NBC_00508]